MDDLRDKQAFTTGEAAELVGVVGETIRRAIRKDELPAAKVGNTYRISRPDLENWFQSKGGGQLFDNNPDDGGDTNGD